MAMAIRYLNVTILRGAGEPGPTHKILMAGSIGQFEEAWVGRSLSVTPHFVRMVAVGRLWGC